MKKLILSLLVIFWGLYSYAQENDTTKIKLGETKIIIIEKDKDNELKTKEEKLEKGKAEFEKMQKEKQAQLEEQQKQLDEMKKMLDEQKDDLEKQKIEKELQKNEANLEELSKELEALDKGIEDIDNELDTNKDLDNDDESKMDHKNKYDWEFDDEWPSDWDHLSPFGKDKKFRGHWAGFELGLNNFVNKDFSIALAPEDRNFELNAGGSWVFTLNFLQFNIPFGRNVGLVTGMGSTWNNYHFTNNVNVYENVDGIMVAEPELQKSYYKNTMNTWNFTIPLIFEFQIPVAHKKPGIFVGLGVVGGAKVLSWGNQDFWMNGDRYKTDKRSDFLINTFRYGLTARIGFKYLKLFANYDMVALFQKDRGPELYPVSVGITLLSF